MNEIQTTPEAAEAIAALGKEIADKLQNDEGVGSIFGYSEADYAEHESLLYRLYRRSRYDEAEQIAKGLLQLDPKRPYAYLVMGELKLKDGEVDEAVPYFLSGMTFAGQPMPFQLKLAECYLRGGNAGGASKLLGLVLNNAEASQAQRRRAQALLKVAQAA
jgi:predicted Zn-dependent protease